MHCGFVYSRDSSIPPPSVHPSVSASHIHPTHILSISDHNSLLDMRVTTASTCGFYLHPMLLDLSQATASLTVSFASQMSWVDPYSQPPFESFTERPPSPVCKADPPSLCLTQSETQQCSSHLRRSLQLDSIVKGIISL